MAAANNPLLAFFSSSVCRALDEHAADLSGSRPPSLLIRDGKQGKQSFPGSIVRLRDSSTHVVALKGGVYQPSEDVVCLQLSPLAGGQAKRWYPAELAQSVEWIVLGCLSSQDFQTQAPQLTQGSAAVAGGIRDRTDANVAVRLVWDQAQGCIRRHTATGAQSGPENPTTEEVIASTTARPVPWASPPPQLDSQVVAARAGERFGDAGIISYLTETVWRVRHAQGDTEDLAAQKFANLEDSDESLAEAREQARLHYSKFLDELRIDDASGMHKGFVAGLLTSIAGCTDRVDLATHLVGHEDACLTDALVLIMHLVENARDQDARAIPAATDQLLVGNFVTADDGQHIGASVRSAIASMGSRPQAPEAAPQPSMALAAPPPPGGHPPASSARPPAPAARQPRHLTMFTPVTSPMPSSSDNDACVWIRGFGGDDIQKLLADSVGQEIRTILTPLGKPASVRLTARHLEELVNTAESTRAWTRDPALPRWAHERPADWEMSRERLSDVVTANESMQRANAREAARVAALPPPPPQPAPAPQQALTSSSLLSALSSSGLAKEKRTPGEARLEKATAPQKLAAVVCSSQVLGPLQDPALIDSEHLLGTATARAVALGPELRRLATFTGAGAAHSARAFVASAGTRLEGDAQSAVPVNVYQARKDALAHLVATAQEAVGRRRLSTDVRSKIAKFCEALLAGAIDLELAVELFGGISPADCLATAGHDEANGTWGKISVKPEIKQALTFAFSMIREVHVPLLDLAVTPALDFGLEKFFKKAQHVNVPRLVSVLKEAFDFLARAFELYRESLAADTPCLRSALAEAIVTALEPLSREQATVRAASAAAQEEIRSAAAGKGAASSTEVAAIKRKLEFLEKELAAAGSA